MKKVVSLLLVISLVASPHPALSSDSSAQANKSAQSNKEYFLHDAVGMVSIGAIILAQLVSAGALFHVAHFLDEHPCDHDFHEEYYKPRGLRNTALASGLMRIPVSFVLPLISGFIWSKCKGGDGDGGYLIAWSLLKPLIAGHLGALFVSSLYLKNQEQIERNCTLTSKPWTYPDMVSLHNGFLVSFACELVPYAVGIAWVAGAAISKCLCVDEVDPLESSNTPPAPKELTNHACVVPVQAHELIENSPHTASGSNLFCRPNETVVLRITSPVDSSQPAFPAADRSEASMEYREE
jgi:hypothetical protein